jgi:hypothetical protein
MILGRTPAGLIKTKSDGGLRAVNCACCNTCGCGAISIPQALRELVANATIDTMTMFGFPPTQFYSGFGGFTWLAAFSYDFDPLYFSEVYYEETTGCLTTVGIRWIPTPGSGELGDAFFGDGQICEPPEFQTTQNGTFTLNGEGAYTYYYLTGIDPDSGFEYLPVPPPNLVFT